jgi:hypothetical protein
VNAAYLSKKTHYVELKSSQISEKQFKKGGSNESSELATSPSNDNLP